MRSPTQLETEWWNRFCKTLSAMPETMEILVDAYGHIMPTERGAQATEFARVGNADNVPIFELTKWRGEGVKDNSGSL